MNKDNDFQLEQHRVNEITRYIADELKHHEHMLGKLRGQVVSIRKNFWDDVTINFDSPDDYTETYASMKQQAEVLSEQERTHQHLEQAYKRLLRLESSPYFGRIDFREDGSERAESVYIGTASLQSQDGMDFLIYDWRAPISSLYYDYAPGPASYDTPGGRISGHMDLKRQFIIRDKQIHSLFDTDLTIGDELLKEVLGGKAGAQMKTIVATIQQEQNRIIRNDSARVLLVQGSAGSGKTSAALQRAAYLLYRYRGIIQSDQLVLFSPNPMFNSYVSNVLPELGEENLQQTTFQEYLEHRIGRVKIEDPFDQLEMLHTSQDPESVNVRKQGITFKASLQFMHVLDRYKQSLETNGMIFRDIKFRDRSIITKSQIHEIFYSTNIRWLARIEQLKEWLTLKLKDWEEHEWQADWVQEEIELLDDETYHTIYRKLKRQNRGKKVTFDDYDKESEMLSRMIVKEKFKPLYRQINQMKFIPYQSIYLKLFSTPSFIVNFLSEGDKLPDQWEHVCTQTINRFKQKVLPYEDTTPFLYFKNLIEGFQSHLRVRHVFIDEAQDYSPFQFEYLKRLFPSSYITILGDLNQAIYGHASSLPNIEALINLYGSDQTEWIQLKRSYRSTYEITQFSSALLPDDVSIEPFERHGPEPAVIICESTNQKIQSIVDQMQRMRQNNRQSIAILCKTAYECVEAYKQLKEHLPDLKYINKSTASFEGGMVILPVYLAKGIEFEAALIYDASADLYRHEDERKTLYTACTRAMHELVIYTGKSLSPFITTIPDQCMEITHLFPQTLIE